MQRKYTSGLRGLQLGYIDPDSL